MTPEEAVARISVQIQITREEAVHQLEGGHSVEVNLLRRITIIPSTSNVSTYLWRYYIYDSDRVGHNLEAEIVGSAQEAVKVAIGLSAEPKKE